MPNQPSRLFFLARGCKKVPADIIDGKVLWANGDEGYFLSAAGTKQKPAHSPFLREKKWKAYEGRRGFDHPCMRNYGCKSAHRLMAATYADEPCPIFFDSKGQPYKGLVHHVIENPYDIRVDNLIWYLTYQQHHIADKRRRALEAVLPNMYVVPTKRLKLLEDPRETSQEDFELELKKLKKAMKRFSYNPSETIDSRMSRDISRHAEL